MTVSVVDESKTGTLRQTAVRGGALFLSAKLGTQLLQVAVTLLVVRLLQPADYGLVATALAYIGLADILTEAGISRALVQKKDMTEADLAQAFTLNLMLAVVLYGVVFASSGPLGRQLGVPELEDLLTFCGCVVLFIPFGSASGAVLDRELKYGAQTVITTVGALVQSVVVRAIANSW